MIRSLLARGALAAIVLTAAAPAFAQAPPPAANPACQRLEAQLTALDRGNSDPARAQQIRSAEDAVNRQQVEVDRLVSQSRRMGCESSGFFSIFSNPPPACGPLVRQIGQRRSQLERMQNDLERLSGGTTERAAQRQSLLIALGNNGCGPQYRSAALAGERSGFFDNLFGNNNSNVYSPGPMGGTFRTICVRTCDGFYFPVSYATSPDRFRDDEQTCQRMCPAAETQLYTYHNPGEEVTQAVSLTGKLYTELPTAFQYRKSLDAACSCRRSRASVPTASRSNTTRRPRIQQRRCRRNSRILPTRPASPIPPSARCAPSARLSCRRAEFQKSKAFAGLADTSDASGAAGGVPGSRNRLVIG